MTPPAQLVEGAALPELVVVAGAGVSGRAAARVLAQRGHQVVLADRSGAPGTAPGDALPRGAGLVVVSPGWRPDAPLLRRAAAAGVPVWGEVELAWRLRPPGQRWLVVTGTNGKTTTTALLAAMLQAAGYRAGAAGNIGTALVEVVTAACPPEVLAVELSSFQLHYTATLAPPAAGITNLADDHLDWHGGRAAYEAAKARAFADPGTLAVGPTTDPGAARVLAAAAGPKVLVGPGGGVRVQDGWIYDDAFGGGGVLPVADLGLPGEHNLANALVATALARAAGAPPDAVAAALAAAEPARHRLQVVARRDGLTWVDDSKATNPHAAAAALRAAAGMLPPQGRVVWLAGGLNKGLGFDDLAAQAAGVVRAAVLLGRCAGEIRDSLARHAPDVPALLASDMDHAVGQARRLARDGDVVLLAPAAASMDMFTDYAHRGEAFAAAVRALGGESSEHAGR